MGDHRDVLWGALWSEWANTPVGTHITRHVLSDPEWMVGNSKSRYNMPIRHFPRYYHGIADLSETVRNSGIALNPMDVEGVIDGYYGLTRSWQHPDAVWNLKDNEVGTLRHILGPHVSDNDITDAYDIVKQRHMDAYRRGITTVIPSEDPLLIEKKRISVTLPPPPPLLIRAASGGNVAIPYDPVVITQKTIMPYSGGISDRLSNIHPYMFGTKRKRDTFERTPRRDLRYAPTMYLNPRIPSQRRERRWIRKSRPVKRRRSK